MFIATVLILSCEKEKDSDLQDQKNEQTPEQIMDQIASEILSEDFVESDFKATRIVSLTSVKISCNTYRLTVTLNQPVCKRNPNGSIVGYWTLFSGAEGKIINLTPTRAANCLTGTQFSMNYTPTKSTLVKIVLLAWDPVSYSANGYLESNTVSLKPGC